MSGMVEDHTDFHRHSYQTPGSLFDPNRPAHAPGELLVIFHRPLTDTEVAGKVRNTGAHAMIKVNAGRKKHTLMPDIYKVSFDRTIDVRDMMARLRKDADIRLIEPNFLLYSHANDPLFPYQWHLRNTGQPYYSIRYNALGQPVGQGMKSGTVGADVSAPAAWRHEDGNMEIVVAVLDTGVDIHHPDLQERIWVNSGEVPGDNIDNDGNGFIDDINGYNFCVLPGNTNLRDVVGHGTHVAGIIAAVGGNGTGVAGVSFHTDIKIMVVKFLGANTTFEHAIQALIYAVDNGAAILSNSWGGAFSDIFGEAIGYALAQGRHIVASAGNYSIDAGAFSPAGNAGVFTVCATDSDDVMASFSNYGISVSVSAPGVDILSVRASGRDFYGDGFHIVSKDYYIASGTSMACPMASAVMAMVKATHPQLPPGEIENLVRYSTDDIDPKNPVFKGLMGTGRINAPRALGMDPGPYLHVERMRILDDNGNGVFQPGETATLRITVRNLWHTATAIQAVISTSSEEVTILSGQSSVDAIDSGQSQDFFFTLSADADAVEGTSATLTMAFTYDQGQCNRSIVLEIAPPLQVRDVILFSDPIMGSPVVADIGGDGGNDIIVPTEHKLHVLDREGTPREGWPIEVAAPVNYFGVGASPAVGDVNGDGIVEIVYISSGGNLNVLDSFGQNIEGFPVILPGIPYNSSAALADIDRDGTNDIIVCSAPWILVYNHLGQLLDGWENVNIWTAINTPSVADIDGDGWLEIIVGNMFGLMFAFDHRGQLLPDWGRMVDPLWISPSVAIADLIPDNGVLEIVYSSVWSGIHVWDIKGQHLSGWPLDLGLGNLNYNYSPSVFVEDLDRDGEKEIFVAKVTARYALLDVKGNARWNEAILGGGIFASPIAANVDSDPQLEIIMPYWNWQQGLGGTYMRIMKADGSEYFHQKLFGMAKHVLASDLDGDDQTELMVTNAMNQLFIIDTVGVHYSSSWSKFKGNNHNTGYIQQD